MLACWLALLLLLGSRGDQGPANSRGVAVSEFTGIPYTKSRVCRGLSGDVSCRSFVRELMAVSYYLLLGRCGGLR